MRKILTGLGIAAVAVAAIVYLRSAGHHAATQGLDRALAHLPPGFTVTHGAASYDPILGNFAVADLTVLRNGAPLLSAAHVQASGVVEGAEGQLPKRIGQLTLQDVTFPPGRHAARLELTGLAPADLQDVLDPSKYPGGKPAWTDRRVLLEHGTAVDLSFEKPAAHGSGIGMLRIGHAHIDGFAAHPLDLPPTPENTRTPAFWAAVAQVTAEKSGSAEKIDLVEPGAPHISIGSDSTEDVDSGRVGAIRLQDVRVEDPRNTTLVKLADFSLGGVDASAALPKLAALTGDPKQMGNIVLGAMQVAKMHAAEGDITVGKGPHIQLAAMDASQGTKPDGTKTGVFTVRDLSVAFDHAVIPPAQEAAMKRFGMSNFVFDLDAASTTNTTTQHATLNRFDLAARGLGALHLTGQASGPAFDGKTRTQPQAIQALQGSTLETVTLRWDDASLTNRIFDALAESRGTTPDALRTQAALMTIGLAMIMPNQPDAGGQVSAFLNNPKSLTISLTPAKPVTMADVLATPMQQRAGLLGVHIQGE